MRLRNPSRLTVLRQAQSNGEEGGISDPPILLSRGSLGHELIA